MIQDIKPYVFKNEFDIQIPQDNDFILVYKEDEVFLLCENNDNEFDFPRLKDLYKYEKNIKQYCEYLFLIGDMKFFMLNKDLDLKKENMYNFNIFRKIRPMWKAYSGITAYQVYKWKSEHKFCGKCGSLMKNSNKERALVCDKCNNIIYPTISPAVIVGLINGNKILMSKYAGRTYKDYALIAGFVEIGETLEMTIHREVMEEVGLKVKNIKYYKSQPWAFSSSLLVGFFAELDGDDTIQLDETELAQAQWFERENVPIRPANLSLTNEMIQAFRLGEV